MAAARREGGELGLTVTVLCGDATEQLKTLSDESAHVCVTSPP
jgi:DNA modification methylase